MAMTRTGGLAWVGWPALLLAAVPAAGPGPATREGAVPADVAAVPADAAGLLSCRLADLWGKDGPGPDPALAADVEKTFGARPEQVERLTLVALGIEGETLVALVRLKEPAEPTKLTALAGKRARPENYRGHTLLVFARRNSLALLDGRTYAVGPLASLHGLLDATGSAQNGPLTAARELMARNHAFVASANLPAFRDRVGTRLPPEAEPLAPLLDARSAVLVADLGSPSQARLRLVLADAGAARKAERVLREGRDLAPGARALALLAGRRSGIGRLFDLAPVAPGRVLRHDGASVEASARLTTGPGAAAALAAELVVRQARASDRRESVVNLQYLALGMHNFFSAYNSLPPVAVYDKAGKPLLSWRVLILPSLGQDALYQQFHLDEPWDSEHNKTLLGKMPKVYAAPGDDRTPLTPYQVFVGKGSLFEGKKGISLAKVPDGVSNTVLIAEAGPGVPWTKPEDLAFDVNKPLPRLGGVYEGGFHVAMADAFVRFLKDNVSEKALKAAIGRDDGLYMPLEP
jgi:hypothetical protein